MTPRQLKSARRKIHEVTSRIRLSIFNGYPNYTAPVRDQDRLISELESALQLLKAYRNGAAILESARTASRS